MVRSSETPQVDNRGVFLVDDEGTKKFPLGAQYCQSSKGLVVASLVGLLSLFTMLVSREEKPAQSISEPRICCGSRMYCLLRIAQSLLLLRIQGRLMTPSPEICIDMIQMIVHSNCTQVKAPGTRGGICRDGSGWHHDGIIVGLTSGQDSEWWYILDPCKHSDCINIDYLQPNK